MHAQDISKTAPDVIFGAVLIAVMILLPAGVAPLIKRLVGRYPSFGNERRMSRIADGYLSARVSRSRATCPLAYFDVPWSCSSVAPATSAP